jgi:hypothetical protein
MHVRLVFLAGVHSIYIITSEEPIERLYVCSFLYTLTVFYYTEIKIKLYFIRCALLHILRIKMNLLFQAHIYSFMILCSLEKALGRHV